MQGMTIEKVLLAKNIGVFNRILDMFKHLVIKNSSEAANNETVESNEAYLYYEAAYEETDTVKDYVIDENDLMVAGFTPIEAIKFINDMNKLQALINAKSDVRALNLISKKRKEKIDEYVELNPYYKSFVGLPPTKEEYIEVSNADKVYDYQSNTVYLHEVKPNTYPETFNKLFVERNIDAIYDKYDYVYLKFIEKPLSPYIIHNKEQFEICHYKEGILQPSELQIFFESYTIARNEIMMFDYIEAFERTYNAYVDIMFLFILFYTFIIFCSKSLQRYAMRDYTDEEIYDILDSNNLSALKTVNIGLIKNVIAALPDLRANVGTRNVIDIIFDIVADNSISVKEFYLEKRYNTDDNGNLSINPNVTYDKNVDLVFKESVVKRGSEAAFSIDQEIPYEDITSLDDTWGGTHGITDQSIKDDIKRKIKLEILEKDFSSILTKYLSISKIVDMYAKTINLTNKLGIFYQLNENRSNFLRNDKIEFNGIETTALSIYASWCLIFATLTGLTDPDYIVKEASAIEDVLYLRKSEELDKDALKTSYIEVSIGDGIKRTIGDYLNPEEIKKHLVHFNFLESASITEILKQYDANYEIIKAIDDKMINSSDYDEYTVWQVIKKSNMMSKNIDNLFNGFTTYSNYIKYHDPIYWKYIEPYLTDRDIGYKIALKELYTKVQEAYRDYIINKTQGEIVLAVNEQDIAGGENIEDIATLFNEFMSYYTQIYKQNFNIGYDDPLNNSLVLLYSRIFENIVSNDEERLELIEKAIKDTTYGSGIFCNLELLHYTVETFINTDTFDLELTYDKIEELLKALSIDNLSFKYEKFKEHIKTSGKHDIELSEVINIY
jgi:hypothetical protein